MTYAIDCKDVNNKCDYHFEADTYEKLVQVVTGHYHEHHDAKEMTPELQDKVNSTIPES